MGLLVRSSESRKGRKARAVGEKYRKTPVKPNDFDWCFPVFRKGLSFGLGGEKGSFFAESRSTEWRIAALSGHFVRRGVCKKETFTAPSLEFKQVLR